MASATADATSTSVTATVVSSFPSNPLTTTFSRPADCNGIYLSVHVTTRGGVSSVTTVTCCPTYNNDISLWLCIDGNIEECLVYFNSVHGLRPEGSTDIHTSDVERERNNKHSNDQHKIKRHCQCYCQCFKHSLQHSTSSPTTSASDSSTSGLSTGAKIGLGVAIPLVVIAIIAALFFWWRSKRKQKHAHAPVSQVDQQDYQQDVKPHIVEASNERPIVELPGSNYQYSGSGHGHTPMGSGASSHSISLE
ncbi:hypothetical protein MRB53_038898 [Persea americana]|nr:hypothetical protein MRB53_038898 [Persea americana]